MKTLIGFFVMAVLLFASCAKDEIFNEPQNVLELKKAKVPIPLKGETCMVENAEDRISVHFGSPDGPIIPGVTVVKYTFLHGNLTHMGKLDEQSWMEGHEGAYIDAVAFAEGKTIIVATYDARLFAANGDYIDLISHIRIESDKQIISGDVEIIDGSGRFENVTGTGTFNGVIPCWDFEGTLEYLPD